MKILITNVYTYQNRGDAAILSVLLSQLKLIFPGSQIDISTTSPEENNGNFEGSKLFTSFTRILFGYKGLHRILVSADLLIGGTITCLVYKLWSRDLKLTVYKPTRILMSKFMEADLIIGVGGGYLGKKEGDIKGTLDLCIQLYPVFIGNFCGKQTILYSQSIGPFVNKIQNIICCHVLNGVDGIFAREDVTHNILLDLGIPTNRIWRTVDAGFLFRKGGATSARTERANKKKKVGITVRKWPDSASQTKYEDSIAETVAHIINKYNYEVVFVAQVTAKDFSDDDRMISRNIIKRLPKDVRKNIAEVTAPYDQILKIYSSLWCIIGTRFHSVIFSISNNIPSIAIEYEHKTMGIMEDLGLESWVIPIEKTNGEKLIHMFDKLNDTHDGYVKYLERKVPSYKKKAERTATIMEELVKLRFLPSSGEK